MHSDNSRKVDRYFALLMGMVFATTYSIPISAQTQIPKASESAAKENSVTRTPHLQAFSGQLAIFLGHQKRLTSVSFSPDGKQILTASADRTARLWDIKGNLLVELRGHERLITSTSFSPDGKKILTASEDRTARLWDIKGNLLVEFQKAKNQDNIRNAVFSPDGRQIFTIGLNKIRLWDTKGNLLAEFQGNKVSGVLVPQKAVFSPNGNQILTVTSDGIARLWNVKGNLLTELEGHKDKILSAIFSPDGKQIITASVDKTARLWDTKGNTIVEFQGHERTVYSAVFSPDNRQILTASQDGTARIWDTKGNSLTVFGGDGYTDKSSVWIATEFSSDGRQILTSSRDGTAKIWDTKGNLLVELRGHNDIAQARFSPDGRKVVTIGRFDDEIARLWDISAARIAQSQQKTARATLQASVSENNAQIAIFRGHKAAVRNASFSPDGREILTVSNHSARLWDRKGNLLANLQKRQEEFTRAIFSPDGKQIITTSLDGNMHLWDKKGNLLKNYPEKTIRGSIVNVSFSPDGRYILPSDRAYPARLWDTQGNLVTELRVPNAPNFKSKLIVNSTVFSPDGKQILTGSIDGKARLWDVKGDLIQEFQGHDKGIKSVVFSPNGRQILSTGSQDETVRFWDIKGNLLQEFRGHKELRKAIFSADGSQILTITTNKVRLWDTKGNLLQEFRGHENYVSSAAFSPDGRYIIIASTEKAYGYGNAGVWDTKGNILAVFRGHKRSINSTVFSPDSRKILTASWDATARLWDLSVARAAHSQKFRENAFKNKAQLAELAEEKEVSKAEFSPNGGQILTASRAGTARLWDVRGNILTEFKVPQEKSRKLKVSQPKLSPDNRYILAISRKTAYLWDKQGNLLTKFEGHESYVKSAEFSPDSSQVLTTSLDGTARLWDIKGKLLTVFKGHGSLVSSAVFSPDGRLVLTNSLDKTARLWDIKGNLLAVYKASQVSFDSAKFSPNNRHILTTNGYLYGNARLWDKKGNLLAEFPGREDGDTNSFKHYRAEFSPDGNQIIIARGDGTVRLWDIKGNLLAELLGHDFRVNTAEFSPDGRQILTSGADKTVRLWDAKGNLLGIFRGHEQEVNTAVFSPNGSQILSASWDRTVRVWDIETGIKTSAAEVAFIKGNQLASQDTIESKKQALQNLEQALELYRADKNYAQAALTLLSIGKIHANNGQFQSALDAYNQALALSKRAGAKAEQAAILNSLGQLYTELADMETAVSSYNQALPLFYQLNDQGAVATIFNNIGDIHAATEKRENALQSYNQALVISRPVANLAAEANALTGIGNMYITSQEWQTALNAYNQALLISKYLNDKVKEATILNQLGRIYAALGQKSTAIDNYNQALSLSRQLGYKTEEANILYNQAIFNRQQNNLKVAKTKIKTAINIIESLRTQITSQELRQSYFASTQDYYKFYIDLLMKLHQQNPNQGYDAEALHISERARARSLLELITESHANIRTGVNAKLLQAQRDIKQQLDNNEKRRVQLLSGKYTPEQKQALETETTKLLNQYQDIQTKIRNNSPRYAAITQPQPLTLAQIQQQVLDENSIVLEYFLGKDKSYLWAISKTEMTSYELPKNTIIENLVKNFRREIFKPYSTKKTINQAAAPLTKILIEPVADKLSNKRLVIIGDGALQYLPFAALSMPNSQKYQPLIINHEIISLPSASTVALIRTEKKGRKAATKSVAMLADPVFTKKDERLNDKIKSTKVNIDNLANRALERTAFNTGIEFERLPFTRKEAETILKLIPKNQSLQALDFAANRNFFSHPQLSQYRILHLATHGILDSKQPELSGLVLSLFNAKGEPENGFLRLHDIFNLNLSADLVVLSACQTGLGKQIKGEGVIGLTTGFIYAGSPRVVMSLWNVDDEGTFVLMGKFYQKMFQEGLRPSAALRQAQIEMFKDPYFSKADYWAAFNVLGDWN